MYLHGIANKFVPNLSQSHATSTKAFFACLRSPFITFDMTVVNLADLSLSSEDEQAHLGKLVIWTAVGKVEWCVHWGHRSCFCCFWAALTNLSISLSTAECRRLKKNADFAGDKYQMSQLDELPCDVWPWWNTDSAEGLVTRDRRFGRKSIVR